MTPCETSIILVMMSMISHYKLVLLKYRSMKPYAQSLHVFFVPNTLISLSMLRINKHCSSLLMLIEARANTARQSGLFFFLAGTAEMIPLATL